MSNSALLINHLLERTLAFSTISHKDQVSIEGLQEKDYFFWMVGPELQVGSIVAIYIPKKHKDFPHQERGKISYIFSTARRTYRPPRGVSSSKSYHLVFLYHRVHLRKGVTLKQLKNSDCEFFAKMFWRIGRISEPPSQAQSHAFWELVFDNNPSAIDEIRKKLLSKHEFPDMKLYRPKDSDNYTYQIALSCASEDSKIVDKIYSACKAAGIKTYYYRSEIVDNSAHVSMTFPYREGCEIYNDLKNIYQTKALFFVPILSKNYRKTWTGRELAFAQECVSSFEYMIPIRLDNTTIPGLEGKVRYYYIDQLKLEGVVRKIKEKITLKR